MMLEVDKITIPEFITPVGEFLGNNVGMGIDFEHGLIKQSRNIGDFGKSSTI